MLWKGTYIASTDVVVVVELVVIDDDGDEM